MNTANLLAEANRAGLLLMPSGDGLELKALTPPPADLLERIKLNRGALLELLRGEPDPTAAPNPKSTSDSEPAETDEQRRDRHRREQQESAAEGDGAFWQASDRIRRERAAHGNPFAREPVEGGACRAVLDTFADLWEREPQDAAEALAIWESQTGKDALTGAAKG